MRYKQTWLTKIEFKTLLGYQTTEHKLLFFSYILYSPIYLWNITPYKIYVFYLKCNLFLWWKIDLFLL